MLEAYGELQTEYESLKRVAEDYKKERDRVNNENMEVLEEINRVREGTERRIRVFEEEKRLMAEKVCKLDM